MRTLKKVLALTIALATLFSLTAFAAYKDESAIASETMSAVNLVNSLKIMTGDTKGNFNPTATITRAEAAKMVYVVRTGGNTDATGWKGQNVFTDTKGHWAEGFINYCASVGIIAGVGNGKFNPEGKLTGVELAKMLLVAAGYKADIQGYTGSAWQGKVLADAENAGLFNKYAPAYVGAAPRQYAAVMFSNCLLRTNMAVYLNGELVNGAIGTPVLVGAKYFGLATKTGVPTAFTATAITFGTAAVSGPPAVPASADYKVFNNIKTNQDLRYQSLTVVYNGNTDEVYDVYASGKSKVYNVNASDVTLKEAVANKEYTLELPGYAKTEYAHATSVAMNYVTTSGTQPAQTMAALYAVLDENINDSFRFIDSDGNDVIDVVVQFNASYGKVTEYKPAEGKFTVKDGASIPNTLLSTAKVADYNKVVFVDSVAKNDIVKLTKNLAGESVISKIEPVKGTFTAVSGSTYTIGGTKYKFAFNAYDKTNVPTSFGKEYSVYTDGKYIVLATTEVAVTTSWGTDFALVIDRQPASGTGSFAVPAKVDVLLASGERKIMEYYDADGATTGSAPNITGDNYASAANAAGTSDVDVGMKGKIVQYVIKDGKISFRDGDLKIAAPAATSTTTFAAGNVAGAPESVTYNRTNKYFTINSKFMTATDDTYVFVKYSTSKYAVVKASELGSIVTSPAAPGGALFYATSTKNGAITLAAAYINMDIAAIPGATTADAYAIYVGGKTTIYDADATDGKGYTLKVMYLDGTEATLRVTKATYDAMAIDTTGTTANLPTGLLFTVTTDTKGVSTMTPVTGPATGYVHDVEMTAFGSNYIVAGSNYYLLADGAKIIFVNHDKNSVDYYRGDVVADDGEELVVGQYVSFTLKDGKITNLIVSYNAD